MKRKSDEEEGEKFTVSGSKDFSCRVIKVVTSLLIFVAGVVLGLVASSHFTPEAQLFFPPSSYYKAVQVQEKESCLNGGVREKEDFLDFRRFLKPENLTHKMSDEELFWRASMVPIKRKYPFKRVPKVAFMFLTRGPLPFLPLWERFFKRHEELFSVYIHALPGYDLNVSMTSAFYGRQIPSQELSGEGNRIYYHQSYFASVVNAVRWSRVITAVFQLSIIRVLGKLVNSVRQQCELWSGPLPLDVHWGTVTLADGERRLLANALLDHSNERFVLLSESCIPVYDFVTVYNYLTGSAQSFVESYDDPSRYGRGRYNRNMLPDIKLFQWRKGSQWFEMTRKLAANIISDTKYYTVFKKYCKPSCYPDEHYLPTYLNMFFGSHNSNRSVTWVDWSKGGPHPAAFGGSDITEGFIQSIRNNGSMCAYNSDYTSICYLFARKFAPSALEPLLNLTSTVMKF
ncbi:hypothetical protein GIB67_037124 [Kingdonia uniflora]|uniref:Core-2/I-branching beta-1,6-N-acetylglucosaminyltransferase family protein n=1 Tax=Kingdonia uniflora TaxID=39325 RepID=A0A7J7LHT3_9MAGN|nr:hypothetical protein GIB67_037124 [Kingdonia uniflora]